MWLPIMVSVKRKSDHSAGIAWDWTQLCCWCPALKTNFSSWINYRVISCENNSEILYTHHPAPPNRSILHNHGTSSKAGSGDGAIYLPSLQSWQGSHPFLCILIIFLCGLSSFITQGPCILLLQCVSSAAIKVQILSSPVGSAFVLG
jgi:hypothetical protein